MPELTDQDYLEHEQYKDAHNLDARIQLHQRFSTNPYGWFRWLFDQYDLPHAAKLLEIGCGPGSVWSENLARIPVEWHVTLSDFSPGMVKAAKKSIAQARNHFMVEISNGMAIPFPSNTFDAVIANHVLYHIPDRKKALAEIKRVLKPCGRFFASTIGGNHLLELYEITGNFTLTAGNYYSPALDPSGFTLENGTQQLEPYFKCIEVRYYPDALVITEAQPLLAYILSMIPRGDILPDDADIADLSALINQRINQNGSISIQKSSGLFVCIKKDSADV